MLDSLAISVLEFELDGKSYTAYRKGNVYALREDESSRVRVTTSYPEWTEVMAGLFDFRLMLPTHQETLAQATPPYLFLPYYMDQDGSWLHQWNSFDKLTQFASWKKPLAAYVTGQRPNGYYLAKFPVRLELIDDAVTLRKVISELEVEHRKCEEQLADIHGKINRVKRKMLDIEKTLQTKKGMLRLQDVVDSQSSEVIRSAFAKDIDSLKRQLVDQEKIAADAKFKVGQFDLPERTKAINDFYSERMELFASELGVRDLREDVKKRPDAGISASGSALPRSLLAYQFAVLHTAKEKGDAKHFPVVIDSPNQQGQDADHLRQMLGFIVKRTPVDQQLILAVEDMPSNFNFDGGLVELGTPFGLLDAGQYDLACDELRDMVVAVEAGLDQRLVSSRVGSFEDNNEPS